jgi:hypothetical protein
MSFLLHCARAARTLVKSSASKRDVVLTRMSHGVGACVMEVRKVLYALAWGIGVTGAAIWFSPRIARAERSCPMGLWASAGTCCAVGHEFLAEKQACVPTQPERRCVDGHIDDCVAAARLLEVRSATGAGYALELYRFACDEGYAPGCRGLGTLYEHGLGVARDTSKALALWESACAQGDAPACTLLAHGLLRDGSADGRVVPLLTIGCHRGDAVACAEYAEHLATDTAKQPLAQAYYRRACDGGHTAACLRLAEPDVESPRVHRARSSATGE